METAKARGNEEFRLGLFDQAIRSYTEAIVPHASRKLTRQRFSPQTVSLYTNRALCFLKTRQFALARDDARSAVDLDSRNVKGFHLLGKALLALDEYDDSEMALNKGP
jgi:STIP1 homology and U-box containing protein 1